MLGRLLTRNPRTLRLAFCNVSRQTPRPDPIVEVAGAGTDADADEAAEAARVIPHGNRRLQRLAIISSEIPAPVVQTMLTHVGGNLSTIELTSSQLKGQILE
jgi:hypothetical protein